MAEKPSKSIPLYGLEIFSKKEGRRHYEVEVFDHNRHFEVHYPHRHDFFEILFLTKGSGQHTIDFKDYAIQPNSIFFLSPGQVHSISLSKDIYGYIFLFSAEFFLLNKLDKDQIFEYPFFYPLTEENPPLVLEQKEDVEFLKQLFIKGCGECTESSIASEEMIHALLKLILANCKKLYPTQMDGGGMKKGQLLVKRFRQLIEEFYNQNFSVKDYAEKLSITPSHLNETVKSLMGKTASDLINEKMIIEIKKLLLYSDMTAAEIAYSLNYSDQSYFSKFFKKHTGQSPKVFKTDNP